MNWNELDLTLTGLKQHYSRKDFTPSELLTYLLSQCQQYDDKNIWIRLLKYEELIPFLDFLDGKSPEQLPLYGVPFAIKDNIDLAGIPTTAACEAFTYTPTQHAFVVEKLLAAGAIPLGKTNMDQFATGLVGTRSPWGPCKNAFDDNYISGGSSAGSAVAVSLGLVSFSLGTDTAGSGRVPAALNNIVGLKPSKGLLSTQGVVPACRSLDVVSIFTLTTPDANEVFDAASHYDSEDIYARQNTFTNSHRVKGKARGQLRLGVPREEQLEFFGDPHHREDFLHCQEQWQSLGAEITTIDFQPFMDAAALLYQGPWVTERYIATKMLVEHTPQALHPTIHEIVSGGSAYSAEDAFNAQYRLAELKKKADKQMQGIDLLLTPTAATTYSIEQVLEDPIALNSQLGYYTNYMNLLDYAAIALPYHIYRSPLPNGFTLVAPAFQDQKLLAWGSTWQSTYPGTLGHELGTFRPCDTTLFKDGSKIQVVVCGAHLEGQPLNWQLTERKATFVSKTQSSPNYRLFALADGKRPGMVRDSNEGTAIEVEVWEMPHEQFGSFVAAIPAPLGIGKVELEDGTWASGFICDGYGLEGATDISHYGSWRRYLAESKC